MLSTIGCMFSGVVIFTFGVIVGASLVMAGYQKKEGK